MTQEKKDDYRKGFCQILFGGSSPDNNFICAGTLVQLPALQHLRHRTSLRTNAEGMHALILHSLLYV